MPDQPRAPTAPDAPVDPQTMLDALRVVVDPEIGLNIVDLGLVYGVNLLGGRAHVLMTLTTAGCPLQAVIEAGVCHALRQLPGVESVDVEFTWDPPWSPEMMSAAARRALGYPV